MWLVWSLAARWATRRRGGWTIRLPLALSALVWAGRACHHRNPSWLAW